MENFWSIVSGTSKLFLLKILSGTVYLPLRVRYLLTDFLGVMAFLVSPSKRQGVRKNLSLVLNHRPTIVDVLRVFLEYGRYWAELPGVNRFWQCNKKIIHGTAPHEDCFLGLTFHIGNFEIFGNALHTLCQGSFNVVAERLHPQFLADHFSKIRQHHFIRSIPHDNLREILQVFKDRKPLGILCDRMVGGRGVEVRLFDRRVQMPLNIVDIAIQKKIPVYVSYCVKQRDGLHLYFRKTKTENGFESVVHEVVSTLQQAIKDNPFQWHVLSPIY